MQQQERDLIAGLFGRLQQFEAQPRDAEAERLIKEFVARQPASPYLLVQTVLVQEQALKAAQERIAELEAKAGAAPAASASWARAQDRPVGQRQAAARCAAVRRLPIDTLATAGRGGARRRRRRLPAHGAWRPRPASPAAPCCSRASAA